MLLPTPVLRPSPQDLGDVFANAFLVFRSRFGLLVLITLIPMLFTIVPVIAIAIGAGAMAAAAANADGGAVMGSFGVTFALAIVAMIIGVLLSYKAQAMVSAATYEIGQGHQPTFRSLLSQTKGFLPRFALVLVIFVVLGALLAGVVAAIVMGMIGAQANSGTDAVGVILAMGGLAFIVIIAAVVVGVILTVKLLYVVPAIALEGLGAGAGIARAWNLTKKAFWRTLGYYLVCAIAISVIDNVVTNIPRLTWSPMAGVTENSNDARVILASLAALAPLFILTMLLAAIVSAVTAPFKQIYVTVMYLDQLGRTELPAGTPDPAPWAPPQYQPPADHWTPGPTMHDGGYPPPPPPPPGANH